ncbi:MAG: YqiJ family protein [Prevotella sp.]|jgi:hypothetical protein|nr:YqiJ family protein [Prevotella sp.]
MTDILHNLMHPLPNAVMTVIMGILVIYWIFVTVSGIGFEDIDLGFDLDVDVPDADVPEISTEGDADADGDVATEKEPGFFVKALNFLNVGKVPFMLIITTLKFFMWMGTLITTSLISVVSWGLWSLFILIPIGIIALFFTKLATNPMAKFFKEIGYKGEEEIDFLGRSGKMLSNIKDKKIGSAEVVIDKNPMKLSVMSIDGSELKYGDYIIIVDESDDKKIYYVSKEISIRNF